MNQPIDLRPDHAEIVRDIHAQRLPPGVKVRAFGSRAKWTAKAHSDLDLALKGDAPLSASLLADLAEAFSESDLPFKVDVVDWRAVGLGLQQAIDRDGVELNFGAGAGASMRPDWPLVELARLVEVERGISYGIVQPGAPVLQGVPIVRVADVKGGRIDTRSPLRVAKEIEASYSRTRLRGGELLITIVGSVGETAIVPDALAGWNVARAIAVLPVKKDIGAYWVQLALKAPTVRGLVNSRLNTTVQATLNLGDLAKLPMLLPPASERERIASILGALDDKIDLNRRMNETLEAMARTIFKDWFVDFGPTRAKIEGRPPYLAPDVWALFPDRLDEERKPEGWQTYRLGEIASHSTASISPNTRPAEVFEHFSIPAYDAGGSPALDLGESIKSNKFLVPDGAVLLSKLNPEISRVWLPEARGSHAQVASTEFLALKPNGPAGRGILYCLFTSDPFKAMIEGMVTGTSKSHQRISPPGLMVRPVLAGSRDAFAAFELMVGSLLHRQLANRAETRTLAATRDLLLPKLMSGEIRVRDAGKLAEAAA